MGLENLPAGANISIGAGFVLAMVVAALIRGLLVPGPVHQRLLTDFDKEQQKADRNSELLNRLVIAVEKFTRRRVT